MRPYVAAGSLLLAFLIIYLPNLGHGFIKDDFAWIVGSQVASFGDAVHLFERNVGFYRPLVSASFAVDYHVWRLDPFGYGLTNLAVFFVDAVLLLYVARRLLLPRSAALLSVSAWAFNFHGVNMSLLWISGRTALLMCMFALAAALAVLGGRKLVAGILSLLAMLCKEEAVLLPVFFVAFDWLQRSERSLRSLSQSVRGTWPAWAALALYWGLRIHSGAFGPQDAPPHYQFSFSPLALLRNVFEYVDRGASVACAILLVMWLFLRRTHLALNADEKRALGYGSLWFVSFYALTVFLPGRSDLYALTPSVGSALAVGSVGSAVRRMAPRRFELCCATLVIVVFLVIPIYRQRNERWLILANLSADVMRSLELATITYSSGHVILVDDPSDRFGLYSSFGEAFGDAVRLRLGPAWTGEVTQSPVKDVAATSATSARFVFVLRNGQLVPAVFD